MKHPRSASHLLCLTLLAGAGLHADTATNLDVTGDLSATGNLYIDGNTAAFGAEGADAGYIQNYVPASDTVQFNATSSAATWLWRQGPASGYVPQMQLNSDGSLALYRAGGVPGVLLNPAHASGVTNEFIKLFSSGNADGTAQRIAGYSDVRNGYVDFKRFTAAGPVTGLVIGTFGGDVITVRSTGAGDPGNVGIGTIPGSSAKLEVNGNLKVSGSGSTLTTPSVTLPDGSTLTTARTNTLYTTAGAVVASVGTDGKVNFATGLSVGTGGSPATITPNSTAYLNQTLANLGFRETNTATAVKAIPTTGAVTIKGLAQDASFVYATGVFTGAASIGGASVTASYPNINAGFVAKVSSTGVAQWVRVIQSPSAVNLDSVAVDGSGNVAVAGSFSGTTSGLTSPVGNLTGSADAIVIKYNASGTNQWAQRMAGTYSDGFTSVAIDSGGNVVAAGSFTGTTTGLTTNLTSNANNPDAIVVKYNGSTGASLWAQRVGGVSADGFASVAVDGSGNVVAAGRFTGTTTGLSTNLTAAGVSSGAMVVKYNGSTGADLWAQAVSSANGWDEFRSVAVDAGGNVVAAGFFSGTTSGLNPNLSGNGQDALVVKYNGSTGAHQWSRRVGGTYGDDFKSVGVDAAGNVVTAGYCQNTTTGLTSNLTSNGGQDGIIVKYDASGVNLSVERIGGAYNDTIGVMSVSGNSIWAFGVVDGDATLPFGDTRLIGSFAVGWSGLPVSTPVSTPASFAWGGSAAVNTGVALGSSAYASAQVSAALGASTATAQNSFAGGTSLATGASSSALGEHSRATGFGATALGVYAQASGYGATAMGAYVQASGYGATALGANSYASGFAATALGEAYATGTSSTAMGSNASAGGFAATAMGSEVYAMGDGSTVMGISTTAQAYASTVMGALNVAQGSPHSWVETDDVLVIGGGDLNEWVPRNVLSVHKNGNMRVRGTVQAKGGFRTPPMGDIGMGDFTAGPTPGGQTTDGSSSPDNLDDGLRYSGE